MRWVGAFAGFLGGMIFGFAIAFGGYLVWTEWLGHFDPEGAGGMAAIFVYGPMIGLALGVILAPVGWKLFSR